MKNTVKMGDITTDVKAGKTLEKAAKSIELKVGSSSIKLEPTKITIKSVQVEIKGDATVKAEGSAMTEIKGGIVKIN
jgi:type VI secretion system secreted protein VgrG